LFDKLPFLIKYYLKKKKNLKKKKLKSKDKIKKKKKEEKRKIKRTRRGVKVHDQKDELNEEGETEPKEICNLNYNFHYVTHQITAS
jgi:hypothetical protein